MRRGRRLGIDLGDVRIGVATCDPDGLIATPVETIQQGAGAMTRLVALAEEYQVIEMVVGLPLSLSGREGPAAAKVRAFASELASAVAPVAVRLVDERMSTMTADSHLRASGMAGTNKQSGKKRRAVIDQAAATVILQSALDAERTRNEPPGEGMS
ncbi:MAG TPA: Holliday junction resolvase RuvX [Aeromicrobium sp.]|nr:Holliday junction resolvase RuvX [Aeromicrobium sp.]HKY56597.1 Holliday junction resolvase RuvX [Aeromicrobium sp.]